MGKTVKKQLTIVGLGLVLLVSLVMVVTPSASAQLTTRDQIYIVGDDEFTLANGVTGGSGTELDPYVIENWAIAVSNKKGIWIENTTKFFIIRNCLAENGLFENTSGSDYSSGIYLNHVINGVLENNSCKNNVRGISLDDLSENNNISNNICSNNQHYGILIDYSSNNILDQNVCDGSHIGISIAEAFNAVFNNSCRNNSIGIRLFSAAYNSIENNNCSNNSDSGIQLITRAYSNTVVGNTCENNSYGIYVDSPCYDDDNNILSNNTFANNSIANIYDTCGSGLPVTYIGIGVAVAAAIGAVIFLKRG